MKNLDRIKKQNVRSSAPTSSLTSLSLEKLRQVAGGGSYSHTAVGSVCVGEIQQI